MFMSFASCVRFCYFVAGACALRWQGSAESVAFAAIDHVQLLVPDPQPTAASQHIFNQTSSHTDSQSQTGSHTSAISAKLSAAELVAGFTGRTVAAHCVTLVTRDRRLDLECADREQVLIFFRLCFLCFLFHVAVGYYL